MITLLCKDLLYYSSSDVLGRDDVMLAKRLSHIGNLRTMIK